MRAALDPNRVGPFEMKGARPARLMAETIVAADGVPEPFARGDHPTGLLGRVGLLPKGTEIGMMNGDRTA